MTICQDLQNAVLDDATIDQLFDDITSLTTVIAVIPKTAERGYVAPESMSLDEGRQLLSNRTARGIQIRYQYQQQEWWDTLMILPDGMVRLVRIAYELDGSPAARQEAK